MRHLVLLTLACPAIATAGGDFAPGAVSALAGERGHYTFTVTWDQAPSGYEHCRQARVEVQYERVPWFSWMPFVDSSHPTREQTDQAAALLAAAQRSSTKISFGYMGEGLIAAKGPCRFRSKGLRVEQGPAPGVVLSYYQPV